MNSDLILEFTRNVDDVLDFTFHVMAIAVSQLILRHTYIFPDMHAERAPARPTSPYLFLYYTPIRQYHEHLLPVLRSEILQRQATDCELARLYGA